MLKKKQALIENKINSEAKEIAAKLNLDNRINIVKKHHDHNNNFKTNNKSS